MIAVSCVSKSMLAMSDTSLLNGLSLTTLEHRFFHRYHSCFGGIHAEKYAIIRECEFIYNVLFLLILYDFKCQRYNDG